MAARRDTRPYEERRSAILESAAAEFAASGFTAATMASIHRRAGISSGTLFHYFPTKIDLLLGVLDAGRRDTERTLQAIEAEAAGAAAILRYASHVETEITDAIYPGLVRAVADVERLPQVAEALAVETALIDAFIRRHLPQDPEHSGTAAPDASAARAIRWMLDGASTDALVEPVPAGSLERSVARFLDGGPPRGAPAEGAPRRAGHPQAGAPAARSRR
ncbi:TetR/AcrR family transcriptional regulator [Arenivirga flava]|nr:TetR/AcrR family transcriptional regulator [Arenivirga flava]